MCLSLFKSSIPNCLYWYYIGKQFRRVVVVPLLSILIISGCATKNYWIDARRYSENQDARVRDLVIHYTALPLERSIEVLSQSSFQVSAHYLVPDKPTLGKIFNVYRLVPDKARAWHAGVSYWQGERLLNSASIGIEIVNLGYPAEDELLPLTQRRWFPFPDDQFRVVAELARKLVEQYKIKPYRVVGHSDIAPTRKLDPGPLFAWQRLYEEYGIGAWPDQETVNFYITQFPFDGDLEQLKQKLSRYGYEVPQDSDIGDPAALHNVLAAFQMHFRPVKRDGTPGYDGLPDVETVAILDALLQKYFGVKPLQ